MSYRENCNSRNSKSNGNPNAINQRQGQQSNQRLLQDQNFAVGTFMMCMSCAESLYISSAGWRQYFSSKKFKSYDKSDYSSKTIAELREQFATQLFLLKNAIMIFK